MRKGGIYIFFFFFDNAVPKNTIQNFSYEVLGAIPLHRMAANDDPRVNISSPNSDDPDHSSSSAEEEQTVVPLLSAPSVEHQLTMLLSRIQELEASPKLSGGAPRVLGQSRGSNPEALIREVRRDHSRIGEALRKARKPFDKPPTILTPAGDKDKEGVKGTLYDLMRVLPALALSLDITERISELPPTGGKVRVSVDEIQAVNSTLQAVLALLTIESQALRLRIWKNSILSVAPSLKQTSVDALIAKFWLADDLPLLLASAQKEEIRVSALEANKNIAKILLASRQHSPGQQQQGPIERKRPPKTPRTPGKPDKPPLPDTTKAAQPGKAAADNE